MSGSFPDGPLVPIAPGLIPFGMSEQAFEALLNRSGTRLAWAKSHQCPCTFQGLDASGYGLDGGAREDCQTCRGLGVYWDAFSVPFMGLVGFGGFLPMPAEPGTRMNEKWGQIAGSTPLVTIPYTGSEQAWTEASTFDQVVEVDTPTRFTTILKVGVQESLPYVNGCSVAQSGAVQVWDQAAKAVTSPPYSVAGTTVQIGGYEAGTPYSVEFYADQTYVLFRRSGGLPHVRPFGGRGTTHFPRRFTVENLDLWLRQRTGNATPPNWNATTGGQAYRIGQPPIRPLLAGGQAYPIGHNTSSL